MTKTYMDLYNDIRNKLKNIEGKGYKLEEELYNELTEKIKEISRIAEDYYKKFPIYEFLSSVKEGRAEEYVDDDELLISYFSRMLEQQTPDEVARDFLGFYFRDDMLENLEIIYLYSKKFKNAESIYLHARKERYENIMYSLDWYEPIEDFVIEEKTGKKAVSRKKENIGFSESVPNENVIEINESKKKTENVKNSQEDGPVYAWMPVFVTWMYDPAIRNYRPVFEYRWVRVR